MEFRRVLFRSDRDYFIAQKQNTASGLYLGAPLISRISANAGVALSRRLDAADGSFDGVVVGFLRQSFFEDLFSHVDAPRNAHMLLVRSADGRVRKQCGSRYRVRGWSDN